MGDAETAHGEGFRVAWENATAQRAYREGINRPRLAGVNNKGE